MDLAPREPNNADSATGRTSSTTNGNGLDVERKPVAEAQVSSKIIMETMVGINQSGPVEVLL